MKNSRRNFTQLEKDIIYLAYPTTTAKEIAEFLDRSTSCINAYVQKIKLKKPQIDLVGQKFGKLKIIEKYLPRGGGVFWVCECDCGKRVKYQTERFKNVQSCGCLRLEKITKSFGHISGSFFSMVKRNAVIRKLEFSITMKDLDELIVKQNFKCALSDLPIKIVAGRRNTETTASVDRIDNKKGYVVDNIQFVDKRINYMKWKFSDEEFIELCKKVAECHK